MPQKKANSRFYGAFELERRRRQFEAPASASSSAGASGRGYPAITTANTTRVPEIKFVRSDSHTVEEISPPIYVEDHYYENRSTINTNNQRNTTETNDDDNNNNNSSSSSNSNENGTNKKHRRRISIFNRAKPRIIPSWTPPLAQQQQQQQASYPESESTRRHNGRRSLSQLFHFGRPNSSRQANAVVTSTNIPSNLPRVDSDIGDKQEREAQWEKRATVLVQRNPSQPDLNVHELGLCTNGSGRGSDGVNGPEEDVDIKEAIRLHEIGELKKSTKMFAKLADPYGANNALSQVLYGLALRHGWGCPQDHQKAIIYLTSAATNSAAVESEALRAGMKKGGSAKGELVLAIFELANCFRHGWGVKKDAVAAKQYYETAANLGDADAMNEVAWCYLEGFGCKRDKSKAAKYHRLLEETGTKTLGNTCIWKDKYAPK